MIDGNTAAINAYQREIDEAADAEIELENMRRELAIDLFEGYVTGNHSVIDEIEAMLDPDAVINEMRQAITEECQRPSMGRGPMMYRAYQNLIDAKCVVIAKRCMTAVDIEKVRGEFGV